MNPRPNKNAPKNLLPKVEIVALRTTVPSLTGLRGLAALWVLLLHAYFMTGNTDAFWPPLQWVMAMGGMGVDIFFTLSAFLLSIPFAEALRRNEPRPDLSRYAKRRFFRIFPAYYLQLTVLLGMTAMGIATNMPWSWPTQSSVLAHSVLWLNAWPLVPAYLPTWWTLPVEAGFYLFLPWFARLMTDRRWYWLLLAVALSLLYRHVLLGLNLTQGQTIYWLDHLPGRLFQFLIGMLAAFFFVRLRHQQRLPAEGLRNLLVLGLTIVLLCLPALGWLAGDTAYDGALTRHPILAYWHLYASICIALLLVAISAGKNYADPVLQSMPMQWLGRISYGIYLWHYPVMLLVRDNMGGVLAVRAEFASFFISSVLITLTLAFLSWHWLEAPILRRVGSKVA